MSLFTSPESLRNTFASVGEIEQLKSPLQLMLRLQDIFETPEFSQMQLINISRNSHDKMLLEA
jgi:hypothetical protein